MFLVIAIAQTVPLFVVAYTSRKLGALNATTLVMLILAAVVGAGAFFVIDAVMLLIAYFICLQFTSPRHRRTSSAELQPKEETILTNFPLIDEDTRVALAAIEFTAKNILKDKTISQADGEYVAICKLLDTISKDGHGKKGTQIITNAVKEAYPQHMHEMMKYLDWRDGKVALDNDSVRSLLARLRRVPSIGST